MALVACHECKEEISAQAKVCPKCGAKGPKKPIWPWIVFTPIGAFVALMLYGMTIPEYESRARAERDVCLQIAAHYDRYICDKNYESAIAAGRAAKKR